MKKRIKRVSELPDWFNLSKYQQAITLTTNQWHTQLVVRKSYLMISVNKFKEPLSILRNKPLIINAQSKKSDFKFKVA